MIECKEFGMQKVPFQSLDGGDQIRIPNPLNRLPPIGFITHNRMPQMLKMDSYLMGSTGAGIDAEVAKVSIGTNRLIACQSFAGTSAASLRMIFSS